MIWGALTNWIAIWMVFNPVEPKTVPFVRLFRYEMVDHQKRIVWMHPHWHKYSWQGGFMKRQDEVSTVLPKLSSMNL